MKIKDVMRSIHIVMFRHKKSLCKKSQVGNLEIGGQLLIGLVVDTKYNEPLPMSNMIFYCTTRKIVSVHKND
jgi:hypothetical protein